MVRAANRQLTDVIQLQGIRKRGRKVWASRMRKMNEKIKINKKKVGEKILHKEIKLHKAGGKIERKDWIPSDSESELRGTLDIIL